MICASPKNPHPRRKENPILNCNMIFECQMIFAWRAWGFLEFLFESFCFFIFHFFPGLHSHPLLPLCFSPLERKADQATSHISHLHHVLLTRASVPYAFGRAGSALSNSYFLSPLFLFWHFTLAWSLFAAPVGYGLYFISCLFFPNTLVALFWTSTCTLWSGYHGVD